MKTIVLACAAALTLAAGFGQPSLAASTAAPQDTSVGAKIDRALDSTWRALEQAGEKAGEKLAEAGKKTREWIQGERADAKGDGAGADANPKSAAPGDAADSQRAANARETLGDTAITASIKADFLKDPDLSVLKIDVDARDGVVTLNGLAANEDARKRAERIASAVKGVREVRNYLTVKKL